MARKDISPEKRLLELIERQDTSPKTISPLAAGEKYISVSSWKARVSFFREKMKQGWGKRQKVAADFETVNSVLQVLLGLFVIGITVSITLGVDKLQKQGLLFIPESAAASFEPAAVAALLKPEEYYLDKVHMRDLFRIGERKQEQIVDFVPAENTVEAKLREMTKNLKLVGISWSEHPDAIVENQKLEKTFFIKKGSMIDEIMVRDVLQDRVILRYEGKEVELR
ncbi:MAG: hypothetical protein KJ893_02660 [Candidatus Omnitrophica bacterium]|nr:hypothetical protein [Candidatus Omnitrophota bacterium]MBU4478684.1 hypothetical protein [Candidatus Omnitrophota bacterium]